MIGWVDYRKSVTEGGDFACTEWKGKGAEFQDVLCRKFIDCLGGYGMMDLGWSHPEVVEAVKDQLLNHSPQPSQVINFAGAYINTCRNCLILFVVLWLACLAWFYLGKLTTASSAIRARKLWKGL